MKGKHNRCHKSGRAVVCYFAFTRAVLQWEKVHRRDAGKEKVLLYGAGSRHVRASVVSAGDASSQRSFTALSAKATAAIQALVTGQSQSILVHLAAAGSASARLKGITQPTGGGGGSGRNISAKLIKVRQRNLPESLVKGNSRYDILLIFLHVGLYHEISHGQETKINFNSKSTTKEIRIRNNCYGTLT